MSLTDLNAVASALETGFKTEDDNVRDQSALKTGDVGQLTNRLRIELI